MATRRRSAASRSERFGPVRVEFGSPTGRGAWGNAEDAVHGYLCELARLGVVRWARVVGRDLRGWFAHVELLDVVPAETATGLLPWFTRAPRWRRLGAALRSAPVGLAACHRLVLWSNFAQSDTPVRDFDSGRRLLLSALPIDDTLRRETMAWARMFASCDELWFGSDVLEQAAYRELSRPASRLQRHARDIASRLERVLHRPVFGYLVFHADDERNGDAATCPSCGGGWRRAAHGSHRFTRRCDPCRLVSHGPAAGRSTASPKPGRARGEPS